MPLITAASIAAIGGRAWLAQRFAIDWNMVGPNGDTHHGDEHQNESYWGFGQSVYAVTAGQVVAVVDSIAGSRAAFTLAANHFGKHRRECRDHPNPPEPVCDVCPPETR